MRAGTGGRGGGRAGAREGSGGDRAECHGVAGQGSGGVPRAGTTGTRGQQLCFPKGRAVAHWPNCLASCTFVLHIQYIYIYYSTYNIHTPRVCIYICFLLFFTVVYESYDIYLIAPL